MWNSGRNTHYLSDSKNAAGISSRIFYSFAASKERNASEDKVLDILQSPRGDNATDPTLGLSDKQLRLNCCVATPKKHIFLFLYLFTRKQFLECFKCQNPDFFW